MTRDMLGILGEQRDRGLQARRLARAQGLAAL